jgi:hypothetical protein
VRRNISYRDAAAGYFLDMKQNKSARQRFRRKAVIWVSLSFVVPLMLAGTLTPLLL